MFFRDWGADGGGGSGGGGTADGVVSDVVNHGTQPLVIVFVLLSISLASVFSSLDTSHSAVVILLVSFTRFLACSMLTDLPFGVRTYLGYMCSFAGILVARYMETVLKPPIQHFTTHDGKIPVIKRRRSSSSSAHAFSAHRSARRTSLPALIQKSQVRPSHVLLLSVPFLPPNFIDICTSIVVHNLLRSDMMKLLVKMSYTTSVLIQQDHTVTLWSFTSTSPHLSVSVTTVFELCSKTGCTV